MDRINQLFKNIILVLLLLLGVATLYAIKTDSPPRFILFLGRFHPLVLHLPIGALFVTFFIDILGRMQKNYTAELVKNLLGFTAIFAILSCFFGFFLSREGGYQKETLDLHLYTGLGTAFLILVLFRLSLKSNLVSNKLFLPFFVLSLTSISVAGHYGSVLTHGDNFLIEYAGLPEKERTIENIDSLKIFDDVVEKILSQKCYQCHNATKQKGELSLITKESILKGGISGAAVKRNNANQSLLISRLLLPISKEEHMPPEGKEQLTKDEIWLLKHWIDNGMDFENYATSSVQNDTLNKKLKKYLVFNAINIPKASKDDIQEVVDAGFRVSEIVPGQAGLTVKYIGKTPSKEKLSLLRYIKEQVIELDFGNSKVSDDMISVFRKLKNLQRLRLNSNLITDEAVDHLSRLTSLEVLNIYGSAISNKGLEILLDAIKPQKIYAWKTNIDAETATRLSASFGLTIEVDIIEGFVGESQLAMPLLNQDKTLFKDSIHLSVKNKLNGVQWRYTLNGKTPDSTSLLLNDKIILTDSKVLKLAAYKKGWLPSDILEKEFAKISDDISSFSMQTEPDERYPGAAKLFDLKEGSLSFKDGNWIGYFGGDLLTTIDLGTVKTVDNISFSCLEDVGSWILFPKAFTVSASKTKNGLFNEVGSVAITREGEGGLTQKRKINLKISGTEARYFKVEIKNHKTLPDWHPSAGNPSWLFVDEIYFW